MECNGRSQTEATRPARGAPAMPALLALNGLLLAALAMVTFGPSVEAQSARSRGEYVAVAGGVQGTSADVIYIADTVNQELIALSYDHDKKLLEGIAWRNLRTDQADLLGGRIQGATDGRSGTR